MTRPRRMRRHGTLAAVTLAVAASACAVAPTITPPVGDPARPPSVAAAAPATAAGARIIALTRRGNLLFAAAEIDGRAVGDFLVDTGAGATLIDRRLADELHLPEVIDAQVQGALFDTAATIHELHHLTVAGFSLATDQAVAIDLEEAGALLGGGLAGIIGFPTLGPAPFTIDIEHASMTLHDPTRFEPPAGVQSELLRINQVPYIEATLENGTVVWLQLDTGAEPAVTLWRRFVKQYPDVLTVPQKRWSQAIGIGGGTQVMESEIRSLHVFGQDYGKTAVIIQDAPPHGWNHPRVAGRIGVALLRDFRITFDPVKRRIWATPQSCCS